MNPPHRGAKAHAQPPASQARRAHRFAPSSAASSTRVPAALVKPPAASSVVRPRATALQPKPAREASKPRPPVASAAYRPSPSQQAVQTKSMVVRAAASSQHARRPVAPPVYRPPAGLIVQPRALAPLRQPAATPAVYRPQSAAGNPGVRHATSRTTQSPPAPVPAKSAAGISPNHAIGQDGSRQIDAGSRGRGAEHVVQPKRSATAGTGGVIQKAGTKPRVFSTQPPGRYLVKLSSDREQFIYRNRNALGLGAVTATYYEPLELDQRTVAAKWWGTDDIIARVRIGPDTWIQLPTAPGEGLQVPQGSQRVLVIDTIGWKAGGRTAPEKKKTFMMDVKIGTYTKSGEQFQLEGAGGALRAWKTVEHNIKDMVQRDSRSIGYDICDGGSEFGEALTGARNGENRAQFKAALTKIIADTKRIQTAVQGGINANAGVVYVGASVFCFFDLHDPNLSAAKLIDPDHPIMTGTAFAALNLTPTPGDVMGKTAFEGQGTERVWSEYKDKWQASFMDGLAALIRFFEGALVTADRPIVQMVITTGRGGFLVRV